MALDFLPKEYETLVKLLFIGNMVVNGNITSMDEMDKDVENLLEKIFSRYKDFNADDLIVYIEEMNRHYVSLEYEDDYFQLINDFAVNYGDDGINI